MDIGYERIVRHVALTFSDQRGDITNILSSVDFNHIALITSAPNSVRGNHYHERGRQYIYVLEGSMLCCSRPVGTEDHPVTQCFVANRGDLLYCPPLVAHGYRFLVPTTFLSITTVPRGDGTHYEDTKPWPVITQEGVTI